MIYKFRLLSSEQEDFIRDFEVRSDQTFYDLHLAIQRNCHYDPSQVASFFLCNDEWEKENEITLFELPDISQALLVMDKTIFSDYIIGIRQKLLYIFDIFNERTFFIEVVDIRDEIPGKTYPLCTLSEGSPPVQILMDDVFLRSETNEQMNNDGMNDLFNSEPDDSFSGDDESIEQ